MSNAAAYGAPLAPPSPEAHLSATIGIVRVICILGIVYVHAWTGLSGGDLVGMNDTPQGLLRWVLMEFLGRSSVPLLSIISGWLVARSLRKRGWRGLVAGKLRTILLPMVLWNGLAILFVSGAAWAGWIMAPQPTSWWWTIDELFCLSKPDDINVQMSFLRDLFVCMAAAPLLVRLPNGALAVVAAAVLAWSLSGAALVLLLRPSILLFFIVGIWARRGDLAPWAASRPLLAVGAAYVTFAGLQLWLETMPGSRGAGYPLLLATSDLLMRFSTALFFWWIAWRIAVSRVATPLLRIEPYMFLLFCAHLIMIWLGGPLIGKLTGPLGAPLYPLFLVAQPLLVLGATLLLGRLLQRLPAGLANVLSGGRLSAAGVRAAPLPWRRSDALQTATD